MYIKAVHKLSEMKSDLGVRLVRALGTRNRVATTPFKLTGEPPEVTNMG